MKAATNCFFPLPSAEVHSLCEDRVQSPEGSLAAPASLLGRSNYWTTPPAPKLLPASDCWAPATPPLPPRPRPAARALCRRPAPPTCDSPALHASSDWLSLPRGWVLAYSTALQGGCSFQTSTVSSGLRLRCRRREPPHGEVGSQLLAVVRKNKSGSCHVRSYPAPHRDRTGARVLSWPPTWGRTGAPLEGAAAKEPAAARAVSVFRLARRGPARIGGWARGCDSSPLNRPPLPMEQRPP